MADAEREPVTEAGGGSPGVSKPDPPAPAEQQTDDDEFERLKSEVPDFHGYDEEALEQYRTLSFYFAQRVSGLALPVAAAVTCDHWGHDAPRGLCRRCGLGVELGKEDEQKQRDRISQREAWLAERQR
jgi:hypothetical protein